MSIKRCIQVFLRIAIDASKKLGYLKFLREIILQIDEEEKVKQFYGKIYSFTF